MTLATNAISRDRNNPFVFIASKLSKSQAEGEPNIAVRILAYGCDGVRIGAAGSVRNQRLANQFVTNG